MKIPYIKIPIADMAAYLASFNETAKGRIFQAVLNFGLYQKWDDLDLSETEQIGYANIKEIVEKEIKSYKNFCKKQKQNAKKMWDKKQNTDEATALPPWQCQAEAKQEAEAETEINKQPTADPAAGAVDNFPGEAGTTPVARLERAQRAGADQALPAPKPPRPKPKRPLNGLQEFSNAVLAEFEDPMNDVQKGIWFKRNCRCLSDILKFCGGEIPVGLAVIRVCVERLEKSGLSGGYEAVCRYLPEYHAEAQKRLQGGGR